MRRILTFHSESSVGTDVRIGPTYYMDADYAKVACRIYAEKAPVSDAEVDIFDDGASIFNNSTARAYNTTGSNMTIAGKVYVPGADISGDALTSAILAAGVNGEEYAEDFNDTILEAGSWVYCTIPNSGGGKNFTVQLELERLTEDDEPKD